MSEFGIKKKNSLSVLDKSSLILNNILSGKYQTEELFDIGKALNNSISELKDNIDDDEKQTSEESFISSISIVQQTIKSTIDLISSIKTMANSACPNITFLESKPKEEDYLKLPYIELWGSYYETPEPPYPNIATIYNTDGTPSFRGQEGLFKLEFAVYDNNLKKFITKPIYNPDESKIKKDTVYLVIQGETVKDENNNVVSPMYYSFDNIDAYVSIVKSQNDTLLAKVNFCFNYPSVDIEKYPSYFFSVNKSIGSVEYTEDMSFTLRIIDNRNVG